MNDDHRVVLEGIAVKTSVGALALAVVMMATACGGAKKMSAIETARYNSTTSSRRGRRFE